MSCNSSYLKFNDWKYACVTRYGDTGVIQLDSENDLHDVVTGARASRTIIALLTGAALAVSGLLMQALTRNPIASPGLFGVNAGAVFLSSLVLHLSKFNLLK